MRSEITRVARASIFACLLALLGGCDSISNPENADWRKYDACGPLRLAIDGEPTLAQSAAVTAGIALWNARAATQISLADGDEPAEITVRFQRASAASFGFYDPDAAMIFINEAMSDAHDIAVTVAHETGHALGLAHVDKSERLSLMNPGNRTIEPTAEDVAAVSAIWGACSP